MADSVRLKLFLVNPPPVCPQFVWFLMNLTSCSVIDNLGLDLPYGLAISDEGNLYIADSGNKRIVVLTDITRYMLYRSLLCNNFKII